MQYASCPFSLTIPLVILSPYILSFFLLKHLTPFLTNKFIYALVNLKKKHTHTYSTSNLSFPQKINDQWARVGEPLFVKHPIYLPTYRKFSLCKVNP